MMPPPTTRCDTHAKRRQAQYQQYMMGLGGHDSPWPYLWVATHGNNIPPGAVPFAEESSGQSYIARAVVKGETCLGWASSSVPDGARINYEGQVMCFSRYEILACAPSLRWGIATSDASVQQGTVVLPPQTHRHARVTINTQPAFQTERGVGMDEKVTTLVSTNEEPPPALQLSVREDVQQKQLAQSKCVVLVNDCNSMSPWWSQVRDVLAGTADSLSHQDWAGADVIFLQQDDTYEDTKTTDDFKAIFTSVTPCRECKAMTPKLAHIFEKYLPLGEGMSTVDPVVLLVFTDGVPEDCSELLSKILSVCQRLDEAEVANHMFRIHLLQVGNDRTAVRPLQDFDDQVAEQDGGRGILNTVSFHRGRGLLDAENIMRILLSATEIPRDQDPDVPPKPPAQVVEARMLAVQKLRALARR